MAARRTRSGGLAIVVLMVLVGAILAVRHSGSGSTGGTRAEHSAPASRSARAGGQARAAVSSVALAALDRLPVKGRAPMTGYDRDAFGPAWSDDTDDQWGHNGCDTRNDILRRDLMATTIEPGTGGCVVLTGVLHDPYGGTTIHFVRGLGSSEAVEIDHLVALGDAWQTGAQQWSATRRQDFANDPLELLAVSGPLNMSKGDGDAATWLPPHKAFRCAYVARQLAVKTTWALWVTPAEKAAMTRVLQRCPGQRLPTG